MGVTRRISLLFLVYTSLSGAAQAQWVQLGPPGAAGSVNAILKSGGVLLASTPGGGVSRSTNGGLLWQTSNVGITNLNVTALAAAGGRVFAATAGSGVFASTDAGMTWGPTAPLLDPTNLLISDNVISLASSGNLLIAGPGSYGAFYSPNGGVNWYPAGRGLALRQVNCFLFKDTFIFAGTATDGTYVTADTGKTWTPVDMGVSPLEVMAFASAGGNLYAATFGSGVFVSPDNGASWHTANTGLKDEFLLSITAVPLPAGGSTLFAGGASGGMFASVDNGTTWTPVTLVPAENTVSTLQADGTGLYAGTPDGVLFSSDAGVHWQELTTGFSKSTVNSLLLLGGSVYAGTSGGVFSSSTRGTTWTRMNEGLTATNVTSIAAAPGLTLLAGTTSGGAFVRQPGDTQWRGTFFPGYISAVGSCGATLLASPAGEGAYYSTDNGATWAFCAGTTPGTDGLDFECFASAPPYAYGASNGKGLYRSSNGGITWAQSNTGMKDLHAHACTAAGADAYLSTAAGMFLSTDNGGGWNPINTGLDNHSVTCLAVTGTTLLAGTADAGVYFSVDNGSHWTQADSGLPVLSIKSIASDGQDVYAGTSGGGSCRRALAEILSTGGTAVPVETPGGFVLAQNYPNPFNPATRISYTIPGDGYVRLGVFDALGREIDRLVSGNVSAGTHTVEWHPSVASGVYFYRIEVLTPGTGSRRFLKSGRMVYIR